MHTARMILTPIYLLQREHQVKRAETHPEGRFLTDWDSVEDAALLEEIRQGNRPAFAALVRRHATRFYRVAYRYLHHREESEDMVQDAFLKLWEEPHRWQPDKGAAFTTWFYRVVVNLCLDRQKRKAPLPMLEEVEYEDTDTPNQEESLGVRQQQLRLEKEIRELPDRQQTALNLCFYEELSHEEAAKVMGVGIKALQSLLMRAKASLKSKIGGVA